MATGQVGGGFKYPRPRFHASAPVPHPQTILGVKIEHTTPLHPAPPRPLP